MPKKECDNMIINKGNITIESYSDGFLDAKMYVFYESIDHPWIFVVDPQPIPEVITHLKKLSPSCVYLYLTHEHFDHIRGVNMFKELITCTVICHANCADAIVDAHLNLASYSSAFMIGYSDEEIKKMSAQIDFDYHCYADIALLSSSTSIPFGSHLVQITHTPGHSPGSSCLVINEKLLFSGDSLIPNTAVITRLPRGSKKDYQQITLPYLRSLPTDCILFPGHGEITEHYLPLV